MEKRFAMRSLLTLAAVLATAHGICDPNTLCDNNGQACPASLTCEIVDTMLGIGQCCAYANPTENYGTPPSIYATTPHYSGQSTLGPATYSTASPSTTCVDQKNPFTGLDECPSRKTLCNEKQYHELMSRQCPRTCGRCSDSVTGSTMLPGCQDQLNPQTRQSDCATRRHLCTDAAYATVMAQQCPMTCGLCGSRATTQYTHQYSQPSTRPTAYAQPTTHRTGSCTDRINPSTGRSDCAALAALCTRSQYHSLMREQCPRTCGFC